MVAASEHRLENPASLSKAANGRQASTYQSVHTVKDTCGSPKSSAALYLNKWPLR